MELRISNVLCLLALVGLFADVDGTCKWPTSLAGTWVTSQSYEWTFDSTNTFLTLDFHTYGQQNFECYTTDGYRYLARITDIAAISNVPYLFDIFICLEFQQLSAHSFLYWRSNNAHSALGNEKAYLRQTGFETNTSTACEIAKPYPVGSHDIMVKVGSESLAAVTCPEEFNSNSYYVYDNNGLKECGAGNSSLNVCNTMTTFTFDYSACADTSIHMLYSNGGVLDCLYFTTDGGLTYLNVFNKDSNPDGTNYYRFSCLVFSQSGSTILATQHPQNCDPAQTDTVIPLTGVDLSFGVESTCVPTKSYSQSSRAQSVLLSNSLFPVLLSSACLLLLSATSLF